MEKKDFSIIGNIAIGIIAVGVLMMIGGAFSVIKIW